MAFSVTSCKDDDVVFSNVDDLDRLPMPMFRKKDNTNIADESDLYASRVITGIPNAIQLHWYGVNGASGYEIRYSNSRLISSNEDDWNDPNKNMTHVILPADQLHYELYNLEYQNDYSFSIRALHPTDPAKNSKWYGMGTSRDNEDYMTIATGERYATPTVLNIGDKDYDGFTILLDLTYDRSKYDQQDADTIEKHFRIENGRFMATHLVVKPSPINPEAKVPAEFGNYELSSDDLTPEEDGFAKVRVTGLDQSALYIVALRDDLNTKAPAEVDKFYNYASKRTKGDPGKDIIIEHKVATSIWIDPEVDPGNINMATEQLWFDGEQKYEACRIDTIITKFNSDITLAEGQTFLLQGGKTYYLRSAPSLSKGFTLKTDPADILAGKGRAKVYMGGLFRSTDGKVGQNWELGKAKGDNDFLAPISVESVIFQDIDFDCPEANNYGDQVTTAHTASGNYFINMSSKGLPIEFESIQVRNCTFQGIVRGFFRVQGANYRKIKQVIIDNNVFFNTGYYTIKGAGYSFIHGEQESNEENICKDLQITNNTFYNTCFIQFVNPTKGGFHKNLQVKDFAPSVVWNIRVENNTFINPATLNKDNRIFNVKYVPGGSSITFKRNLLALAKADDDNRDMHFVGMNMETVYGSGELHLDFKDNYSTGYKADNLKDDGIFSNQDTRFSATRKSAGYFPEAFVGGMTADDLIVKVGTTPLYSTDLFTDPNPAYHATSTTDHNPKLFYTDPETIWSRLQYKSDLKVQSHEIVTKHIGDQRWNGQADPKWFYPAGAPVPSLPETPAE